MPTAPITLIKGDRIDIDTDYRDALPQNMYAIEKPILGAEGYMLCYPGLTDHATGFGADRGAFYNDRFRELYRLSGQNFIKVSTSGNVTSLGTITGTKQASMSYSFNTQSIVADGRMYLYDGATLSEVTDSDLGNPIDHIWIDGYYLLTDGEYIYHTNIDDETSIDPLDFGTAEYSPDGSKGLGKTQDNKVIVFGRYTTESFFNDITNPHFSFSRIEARAKKIGIVATHAKCAVGDAWYITGGKREDGIFVYIMQGGVYGKVSSREIDKILGTYTDTDLVDIRMESRQEDDITFVLLHLPNEVLCLNVNIAKSQGVDYAWSILRSGPTGASRYSAINGVFDERIGQWVFGDKGSGQIGVLDDTVFTQYGDLQEWILYSPLLDLETMSLDEVVIETIPGNTADNDATVAISLTYDGLSYGKEWFQLYGEANEYNQRFIIRRLGYVRDWVGFKFRGATKSRMAFALMKVRYS